MTVTAETVAAWARFKVPVGPELTVLTTTISAVVARLRRDYYLDVVLTPEQEVAVILVTARLWARRNTPEGRGAFGGEIAVNIAPDDVDAVAQLIPRAGFA